MQPYQGPPAPPQAYGHPGGAPQRKKNTPLIVVVLVVVGIVAVIGVAVIGVFAALGIYGVRRYTQQAKTAEGRANVSALVTGLRACYERERVPGAAGELPTTTPLVPASLAAVRGKKYMSSSSDWTAPAFKCAAFHIDTPQYFQYQWERSTPTSGVARAQADLDGDGKVDVTIEQQLDCSAGAGCTTTSPVTREPR